MKDETDRTITFTVRTNGYGGRLLFKAIANWLGNTQKFRCIDMFEQRVDGVPMEKDNDHS